MRDILFPEWRNNAERVNYPFSDVATLINAQNAKVDRDLFDDARIYPVGGSAGMYLSKIVVTALTVSIHIGSPTNDDMASVEFDIATPPDDLSLVDPLGRPAGVLVSTTEKLLNVAGIYGLGETLFEREQTEFDASVVIPLPQLGIRGLLLDDGTLLTGDVYLVGVDGIVLRMDGDNIRVDAIGDPYAVAKACDEAGVPVPGFCGVKTINKIAPNENGDFKLTTGANVAIDNILRVSLESAGVVKIAPVGIRGFPSNA